MLLKDNQTKERDSFCCWASVMHCVRLLQSWKTTRHHNSRGILPNYSPRQTPSAHQKHKLRQPELVESNLHPSVGSCRNICPATPSAGRYTAAMVQCYMQVLADLAKIHTHCAGDKGSVASVTRNKGPEPAQVIGSAS